MNNNFDEPRVYLLGKDKCDAEYPTAMVAAMRALLVQYDIGGKLVRRAYDEDFAAVLIQKCVGSVLAFDGSRFYKCAPNEYNCWLWTKIDNNNHTDVRWFVKYCFLPAAREIEIARAEALAAALAAAAEAEEEGGDGPKAKKAKTQKCRAIVKLRTNWYDKVVAELSTRLLDRSFGTGKLNSLAHRLQPFTDGLRERGASTVRRALPGDYVEWTTGYAFGSVDDDCDAAFKQLNTAILDACGGEQTLFNFLMSVLALCFTGIATQQFCFVFLGRGSNFKTTVIDILNALLGKELCGRLVDATLTREHSPEAPRPDLFNLRHRYVVSSDDISGNNLLSASLRQLTGGGAIAARPVQGRAYDEFRVHCHFVIGGHVGLGMLSNVDDVDGLERRVRVIPMNVRFVAPEQHHVRNGPYVQMAATRERFTRLIELARPVLVRYLIEKANRCVIDYAASYYLPTDCQIINETTRDFIEANCRDMLRLWVKKRTAVVGGQLPGLFHAAQADIDAKNTAICPNWQLLYHDFNAYRRERRERGLDVNMPKRNRNERPDAPIYVDRNKFKQLLKKQYGVKWSDDDQEDDNAVVAGVVDDDDDDGDTEVETKEAKIEEKKQATEKAKKTIAVNMVWNVAGFLSPDEQQRQKDMFFSDEKKHAEQKRQDNPILFGKD